MPEHERNIRISIQNFEAELLDSASRGDTTNKVKVLNYFKARLEPRESPLLGEHILSGFTALCAVFLICLGGTFVAKALTSNKISRRRPAWKAGHQH